jgi:hypothetical protein
MDLHEIGPLDPILIRLRNWRLDLDPATERLVPKQTTYYVKQCFQTTNLNLPYIFRLCQNVKCGYET